MTEANSKDIRKIAELAGLELDPAALSSLSIEVAAIIEFVSQIGSVGADIPPQLESGGELRPDEPRTGDPPTDPGTFAPVFEQGYFKAPRPEAMEGG